MIKKKHAPICLSNMLVLGSLLGLTVSLSGCSKNDDTSNCRDLFTSSYLLPLERQQGSSGVAAAQLQSSATTDDSTSTKVASLSSTEVTTQATVSDRDEFGRFGGFLSYDDRDLDDFKASFLARQQAELQAEQRDRDRFTVHISDVPSLADRIRDHQDPN